jgi:hypothetical protein
MGSLFMNILENEKAQFYFECFVNIKKGNLRDDIMEREKKDGNLKLDHSYL